jgi:transposase-like protein
MTLKLRKAIQPPKIEPHLITRCKSCMSKNFVKGGIRHNNSGDIQKYNCKDCGYKFSINTATRSSPLVIATAVHAHFNGRSHRQIADDLKQMGVTISHTAVFFWIHAYKKKMEQTLMQVNDPQMAFDIYWKIRGDFKPLYEIMDSDTRYWIAVQVAKSQKIDTGSSYNRRFGYPDPFTTFHPLVLTKNRRYLGQKV